LNPSFYLLTLSLRQKVFNNPFSIEAYRLIPRRSCSQFLLRLLGFALGIEVKILFASTAKRLQRKARPNAQMIRLKDINCP